MGECAFERAYIFYRLEKNDEALEVLEACNPKDHRALELRAQLFYRLDRFQEAYDIFRDLLRNHSDDYDDERKANYLAVQAQLEALDVKQLRRETRDEFNSLIDGLMKRVTPPVEQALKMAELRMDQVDQFVLMGAGTRVPRVQEELRKFIGSKEMSRFLNTDEAIAMGALFQAAHLSKGFKVKPFGVEDLVIHPVQVNFISRQKQENGKVIEKPITRQVFQYKSTYPTPKKDTREAITSAGSITTRLLGNFQHIERVLVVGVGGAVPHFTDAKRHARLGQVLEISHSYFLLADEWKDLGDVMMIDQNETGISFMALLKNLNIKLSLLELIIIALLILTFLLGFFLAKYLNSKNAGGGGQGGRVGLLPYQVDREQLMGRSRSTSSRSSHSYRPMSRHSSVYYTNSSRASSRH